MNIHRLIVYNSLITFLRILKLKIEKEYIPTCILHMNNHMYRTPFSDVERKKEVAKRKSEERKFTIS